MQGLSSGQSTAKLGFGSTTTWLFPVSSSQADPLLGKGNNSEHGIGVCARSRRSETRSAGVSGMDDYHYLSASGTSSAPATQPSPTP